MTTRRVGVGMTRRDGAPIRQGPGPREGQKVKDQRRVERSESCQDLDLVIT